MPSMTGSGVYTLLVLVQHTDKVNPFFDKYRPIALFSWNSLIMLCNYSIGTSRHAFWGICKKIIRRINW